MKLPTKRDSRQFMQRLSPAVGLRARAENTTSAAQHSFTRRGPTPALIRIGRIV
jgi:hypothetical protein